MIYHSSLVFPLISSAAAAAAMKYYHHHSFCYDDEMLKWIELQFIFIFRQWRGRRHRSGFSQLNISNALRQCSRLSIILFNRHFNKQLQIAPPPPADAVVVVVVVVLCVGLPV